MSSGNTSPVASLLNSSGHCPIVFVCEHASNYIPKHYKSLGLTADALSSHIAYDIGALELAKNLSHLLDAKLVNSCISRLIYDCNRPPSARDAVTQHSEKYQVPGNQNLAPDEVENRIKTVYEPFRMLLAKTLAESTITPVLVTIHSFNPVYHGQQRDVEIGVIHDSDQRLADSFLDNIGQQAQHCVERNKPYGPEDGVTHTLNLHGNANGYLNVMLEIRNDLLITEQQQQMMARLLAQTFVECGKTLNLDITISDQHAAIH